MLVHISFRNSIRLECVVHKFSDSTKADVLEKQLMPALVSQWESVESLRLPLGGMAARMLRPLSLRFLDALTIHVRMQ